VSTVAILNPRSGRGRASHAWDAVRAHVPGSVAVLETEAPGHASTLTRRALQRGATTVIAVGGDGTISEVVNGFFDGERSVAPFARLAIVPHGTGSDFCRSVNLPASAPSLAAVIASGSAVPIDVMRVRYTGPDGSIHARHAINVVSFGLGGAVAARANRSSKRLGGTATFLAATLQTVLRFSPLAVRLALDHAPVVTATIMQVAVGNGQFQGGGMRACPEARLDDGWLDVTVVGELRLWELVRALPRLYDGRIHAHPRVWSAKVRRLEAGSDQAVSIEIDGEALGHLPLEISVVPRALRLLVPAEAAGGRC
jgi:YegS/Rv2252/BmrU family lipid kinase